jgi:hypothetical protein
MQQKSSDEHQSEPFWAQPSQVLDVRSSLPALNVLGRVGRRLTPTRGASVRPEPLARRAGVPAQELASDVERRQHRLVPHVADVQRSALRIQS